MGKRRRGQEGGHGGHEEWSTQPYEDIPRTNKEFIDYYSHLKIVPDDEFDTFMAALAEPLPITFRLFAQSPFLSLLRDDIKRKFDQARAAAEEPIPPARVLDWFTAPPLALAHGGGTPTRSRGT